MLYPISPYFLIKVRKEEESKKREMDGGLYRHPNYVYMTANTQCGVIEGISPDAGKQFPEAKIGDLLLIHHFVQRSHSTKGDNDKFLAMEDDENKYYNVTSKECYGNNNMCYGIYRDGIIIPHSQYIFLEKEVEDKSGWYQTTEQVYEKLEKIKTSIQYLSRSGLNSERVGEIKKREAEMMILSAQLQSKEYLPYKVAFANSSCGIKNGAVIYVLNIACQTLIEVMGTEYRVVDTKYLGAV